MGNLNSAELTKAASDSSIECVVVANATTTTVDTESVLIRIQDNDRSVTMRQLVGERSPKLAQSLSAFTDEPLLRPGVFSDNEMRTAAMRYIALGAVEKRWDEAWKMIAPKAVYIFSDACDDVAIGTTAITSKLRAQLAFLPYANYSHVRWIRTYENTFEFYILNELRPRGSKRVYTIANWSVVWASHIDQQSGSVMFNGFRDMYDKLQFELTIFEYLQEDLEGGGDAAVKFIEAGGHMMLKVSHSRLAQQTYSLRIKKKQPFFTATVATSPNNIERDRHQNASRMLDAWQ